MLTEQQFISASMTETLSQEKHPGFYTSDLASLITKNRTLASDAPTENVNAPFMDIEDIPIWRENKSTIKIYENGDVEFENEFPLYEEFMQNTLIKAVEDVADQGKLISKTKYTNGTMYLYNKDGELLFSKPTLMPDIFSTIDSSAIEDQIERSMVRTGEQLDLDSIKKRMQSSDYNDFTISRLERNANGNIVLEQCSLDGSTTVRTLFSDDLTKTYQCDVFNNGQLISTTSSYYTQDLSNFSNSFNATGTKLALPCTTIKQTLTFKDGVPKVHSEYKYYSKNITIINR